MPQAGIVIYSHSLNLFFGCIDLEILSKIFRIVDHRILVDLLRALLPKKFLSIKISNIIALFNANYFVPFAN